MAHAPRPGQVRSIDELIHQLRLLKVWAGNPSITHITRAVRDAWRRAGRPQNELPARSTIGNCFQPGRRRPNVDLLMAVVSVLVDDDPAAITVWGQAIRVALTRHESAEFVQAHQHLPPPPPLLVGRDEQLSTISTHLRDGRRQSVLLTGMPGVGKTAAALWLGHHLTGTGKPFRRALFVDLRGSAPDTPPATAEAVAEALLRSLDVTGDRIPRHLGQRNRLLRQHLTATSTLVVLDDIADTSSVRDLTPPPAGSALVATSRHRLDFFGVPAELAPLPLPDAMSLLRHTTGRLTMHAEDRLHRSVAALGGLPLAVRALGRHIREHDRWEPDDYTPPVALTLTMEAGVRDRLAAADRRLPAPAAGLLRLLALHPHDTFDVGACAALAGQKQPQVEHDLRVLRHASLLEHTPHGYRLPAVLRRYATERLAVDHPTSAVARAWERLMRHHQRLGRQVHVPPGILTHPGSVTSVLMAAA
ncbi:AAA family ATPase [Actinoplanes sp. NPDC020271]|uniref:AAA family ATPase n=1 Tax=Actinoplanes sp. NPDC020271 TaxID=3363896 RepID=UPI0037A34C1C